MTREELVAKRAALQKRFDQLVLLGDYFVGAADIRLAVGATLDLYSHVLERMRK